MRQPVSRQTVFFSKGSPPCGLIGAQGRLARNHTFPLILVLCNHTFIKNFVRRTFFPAKPSLIAHNMAAHHRGVKYISRFLAPQYYAPYCDGSQQKPVHHENALWQEICVCQATQFAFLIIIVKRGTTVFGLCCLAFIDQVVFLSLCCRMISDRMSSANA